MKRIKELITAVFVLIAISPFSAQACGVCMGQTDGSQIGNAVNGAIFVMLGFIGLMLTGISGVAFSIWRRSKNPLPHHLEFSE